MNSHPIEIEKFGSALGAKVLNIDLTVNQSDDVKKSLRTAQATLMTRKRNGH